MTGEVDERSPRSSGPYPREWLPPLRRRLLRWYRSHGRDLPWRRTTDPYAIWVSEIMLQQTQVATVLDYYQRFLARFPTVRAFAEAPEQDVLAIWAGLGYYRRARQLHAAARQIVNEGGGQLPTDVDGWRALPGVGRYTAGAIVSFAYGARAPILEANTTRLFSRWLALRDPPRLAESQRRLWEMADALLPRSGASIAAINQAAMELGGGVCLPKQPLCDACPVAAHCLARREGLESVIPAGDVAVASTPLTHVAVVIQRRRQFLLRRNPPDGWWHGLWDFPRADLGAHAPDFHSTDPNCAANRSLVERAIHESLGIDCECLDYLRTIKHAVTRYRIALYCYRARLASAVPSIDAGETWRWVGPRELAELPLTATAKKLATTLRAELTDHGANALLS